MTANFTNWTIHHQVEGFGEFANIRLIRNRMEDK